MGRNSGGNMGGGSKGGSSVKAGATEQGYTKKMLKNILGMEKTIRKNVDESMQIFSSSGDLQLSIGGKGAQVNWGPYKDKIKENSIMTHNHPRALGKTGIKAIGNSFSRDDILTAVKTNASEMRAVTPTYTFSIKRPKGGWGGSPIDVYNAYNKANSKVFASNKQYISKQGDSDLSIDRANAVHFHQVMKIMAKQYGWNYSKKRG